MKATRWTGFALATLLAGLATILGLWTSGVAAQQGSSISGSVTSVDGPEDEIGVDLFAVDGEGNRTNWLQSTRTGTNGPGGYRFDVEPGCYKVTFISGSELTFSNGRRWLNLDACVAAGEATTGVDATLNLATPSVIAGTVTESQGAPVDQVNVDLFAATADGGRGQWLTSMQTGTSGQGSGEFRFERSAGCYVLTFVAPEGRAFELTGTSWYNLPVCIEPDQNAVDLEAILQARPTMAITATIQQDGVAVTGIAADLFTDDGTGQRGEYLSSATSDELGALRLPVGPGCYIITFIALNGEAWEESGTSWLNASACIEDGQETDLGIIRLRAGVVSSFRLGLRVVKEGTPTVAGVPIDFFRANADGSRGEYANSQMTTGGGSTRFTVRPRGCWVMTLMAPEGELFADTGTEWLNISFCTNPDEDSYFFTAYLASPPPAEVSLALEDGPHQESGEVTSERSLDYRVTGTPGSLVAFELLGTSAGCESVGSLGVVVKTATDILGNFNHLTCGGVGPWTIPDDGALTIGFRHREGQDPIQVSVAIAEVVYEDVAVTPEIGSMTTFAGSITTPRDGIDYVLTAPPGVMLTVDPVGPRCDEVRGSPLAMVPGDPASEAVFQGLSMCRTSHAIEMPPEGQLRVRVEHSRYPLFLDPDGQDFTISFGLFEYEEVPLASDDPVFEVTNTVDVPNDGTDYVIDTTGIELLRVEIVDNDGSGTCSESGLGLEGKMRAGNSGLGGFFDCEPSHFADVSEYDSVTLRVNGTPWQPDGPKIGSYRLRFEQVSSAGIPVDVTGGPIVISGALDAPSDQIIYTVTAPPNHYFSVADLNLDEFGRCRSEELRFVFDSFDSAGNPLDVDLQDCGRYGPWRVPADGILVLHLRAEQPSESGSFSALFASFLYERVEVDPSNGPFEATESLDIALDGTDYVIRGPLQDPFAIEIIDLAPGGCDDSTLRLELTLFFDGDFFEYFDVAENGCGEYIAFQLDTENTLTVRASANGTGATYEGSYTLRISPIE